MKKNNTYNQMLNKFESSDGGFVLDDSLPSIVFPEKNDSPEKKKEIKETNEKNWKKYIGAGNE